MRAEPGRSKIVPDSAQSPQSPQACWGDKTDSPTEKSTHSVPETAASSNTALRDWRVFRMALSVTIWLAWVFCCGVLTIGAEKVCEIDQFQCDDTECISGGFVCDGEADCEDSSDEMRCGLMIRKIKVKEGLRLACYAQGRLKDSDHIRWFKVPVSGTDQNQGEPSTTHLISDGLNGTYFIQEERRQWEYVSSLNIMPFGLAYDEKYICGLPNSIFAYYYLPAQDLTIKGPPVKAIRYQTRQIICRYIGEEVNIGDIHWFREASGQSVANLMELNITQEVLKRDDAIRYDVENRQGYGYIESILTIRDIDYQDEGTYSCRLPTGLTASYQLDVDAIWSYWENWKTCFALYGGKSNGTWDHARQACITDGSDLMDLYDIPRDTFDPALEKSWSQMYWVGLGDSPGYGQLNRLNESGESSGNHCNALAFTTHPIKILEKVPCDALYSPACERQVSILKTDHEMVECSTDYFECDDGSIISGRGKVCNGRSDCRDGSDEDGCDLTLKGLKAIKAKVDGDKELECRSEGKATRPKHIYWFKESPSQSGEHPAAVNITDTVERDSRNRKYQVQSKIEPAHTVSVLTIRALKVTDAGIYRCQLSEHLSVSYQLQVDTGDETGHNSREFSCADGEKISVLLQCDGKRNCEDDSDETGCAPTDLAIQGPAMTPEVGEDGSLQCRSESEQLGPKMIGWSLDPPGETALEQAVIAQETGRRGNQVSYEIQEETQGHNGRAYFSSNLKLRNLTVKDEGTYICRTSKNLFASYPLAQPVQRCPESWTFSPWSGTCVKLSPIESKSRKRWDHARQKCTDQGGRLVKIANAYMDEFIHDLIMDPALRKETQFGYWIGLNDKTVEHEFRWLGETQEATYVNWHNAQPTKYYDFDENCAIIGENHISKDTRGWTDMDCQSRRMYICEIPALLNVTDHCSGTVPCHEKASCVKNKTNYACKCNQGFTGNGETCQELNECVSTPDICKVHINTHCVNEFGTYSCDCDPGHSRLYANFCADVDECGREATNECSAAKNTYCVNTVGSYRCNCIDGYERANALECTDFDECAPGRSNLCGSKTKCANIAGGYRCDCYPGYTHKTKFECEERIQLVDSERENMGNIAVNIYGTSYRVCDNSWNNAGASVVCRMFGYRLGGIATKRSLFGTGDNRIAMDEVKCNGTEDRLDDCPMVFGIGTSNCDNTMFAGVICTNFNLVGGHAKHMGNIEIDVLGNIYRVCDVFWDDAEADVVCRTMGYSLGGRATKGSRFGKTERPPKMIQEVKCSGSEMSLTECEVIKGRYNCTTDDVAGVICTLPLQLPEPCGQRKYGNLRVSRSPKAGGINLGGPAKRSKLTRKKRIVSGHPAPHGKYPWHVRLSRVSSRPCGGTVITQDWIITAAHCFEDSQSPSRYSITVGASYFGKRNSGYQRFDLDKLILHESYDTESRKGHDIALVKVKRKNGHGIVFNDNVQPACLPTASTKYPEELMCELSGWGSTSYSSNVSPDVLQWVSLPLVNRTSCQQHFDSLGIKPKVTDHEICAGYLHTSSGISKGDAGGPLVCELKERAYTLMGIGIKYVDPEYGVGPNVFVMACLLWLSFSHNIDATLFLFFPFILVDLRDVKQCHKS